MPPGKVEQFILERNLLRQIFHDSDRDMWSEGMRVERQRKRRGKKGGEEKEKKEGNMGRVRGREGERKGGEKFFKDSSKSAMSDSHKYMLELGSASA